MPDHELVIRITAPTAENGAHWATTIRDLVVAEYGHHMRLDITIGDGEANDGLRERVAAAIHRADPGPGYVGRFANVVMDVRDDELAEWRDLAKSALKEVEQQTERGDDAEVTIARVRDLTGRWAKRTDQLKRAAELLDDALDGPQAPATEPSPDGDTCRPLEINGETIRVHGSRDLTDQERSYASDIADAAKRKFAAEQAQPSDRPRCPDCGLPHNLTPGSRPMSLCQRTRDRIAAEPDPVQAQPTIPTTKES